MSHKKLVLTVVSEMSYSNTTNSKFNRSRTSIISSWPDVAAKAQKAVVTSAKFIHVFHVLCTSVSTVCTTTLVYPSFTASSKCST